MTTTNSELILKKIIDILKTICKIENGDKYSYNNNDKYFIWKTKVQLPNEHLDFTYSFPLNESFFPESLNKYEFFIDIFSKNKENDMHNILTPNQFYDFLINLDKYISILNSDSDVRNIKKLHINRHVNIIADFDNYSTQPISKMEEFLVEWKINNHKPLLLLGDRGMGKTWSVKKFCYDIMQRREKEKNYWLHTPAIYISLRTLTTNLKNVQTLYQAISSTINETYKIKIFDDFYIYQAFLKTGNIILILDGLDEMSVELSNEIANKNLLELFQVIGEADKFIITSRISYFNSYTNIKEHFAYSRYIENLNEKNILHKKNEKRIRRDFNIWELTEFDRYEKENLFVNYSKSGNPILVDGVNKLHKLEKETLKHGNIEYEITELSKIPALYINIVKNLANKDLTHISIYEKAINDTIFKFNISTDRSFENYITFDSDEKYIEKNFSISKKNIILKNIAWGVFSKGDSSFSILEFSRMISDISDIDFDIIVNDIRGQTVIKVSDENGYKFLTESVFAYYIAFYLYDLFEEKKYNEFFNNLGYYNLSKSEGFGFRILAFLGSKLKQINNIDKIILSKLKEKLIVDHPFSPYNIYIYINLKRIGINTRDTEEYDFWNKYKMGTFLEPLKTIVKNDLILIPSKENPFFLSQTEITNNSFFSFLNDEDFHGVFWERYGSLWKKDENKFKNIINVYHLLFWAKGNLPENKNHHPVVYVSWFAAAMFCNWLTFKLNVYKKDTFDYDYYYDFIPYRDSIYLKEVKINNGSYGFRLPDEDEWNFASREGETSYKYIWDKYTDENGDLLPEGIKLKNRLLKETPSTTSVRFDAPNKYGIYGLWGNVREWVNKLNVKIVNEKDHSILKGSTWLLDEEGYKIGNSEEVFAQNTNFDVGFRFAKSLTEKEIDLFRLAYKEFNSLIKIEA